MERVLEISYSSCLWFTRSTRTNARRQPQLQLFAIGQAPGFAFCNHPTVSDVLAQMQRVERCRAVHRRDQIPNPPFT